MAMKNFGTKKGLMLATPDLREFHDSLVRAQAGDPVASDCFAENSAAEATGDSHFAN